MRKRLMLPTFYVFSAVVWTFLYFIRVLSLVEILRFVVISNCIFAIKAGVVNIYYCWTFLLRFLGWGVRINMFLRPLTFLVALKGRYVWLWTTRPSYLWLISRAIFLWTYRPWGVLIMTLLSSFASMKMIYMTFKSLLSWKFLPATVTNERHDVIQ